MNAEMCRCEDHPLTYHPNIILGLPLLESVTGPKATPVGLIQLRLRYNDSRRLQHPLHRVANTQRQIATAARNWAHEQLQKYEWATWQSIVEGRQRYNHTNPYRFPPQQKQRRVNCTHGQFLAPEVAASGPIIAHNPKTRKLHSNAPSRSHSCYSRQHAQVFHLICM
jgi:hypothetical protein